MDTCCQEKVVLDPCRTSAPQELITWLKQIQATKAKAGAPQTLTLRLPF